MASTVLRRSAFRRAVPTAAAATRSWVEGLAVPLPPAHRRSKFHSSAREFDALCELVWATKVSSVTIGTLERIVESSKNARKEFVQKETRRAWMVGAATAGGFFVGCLTRTRKMDDK